MAWCSLKEWPAKGNGASVFLKTAEKDEDTINLQNPTLSWWINQKIIQILAEPATWLKTAYGGAAPCPACHCCGYPMEMTTIPRRFYRGGGKWNDAWFGRKWVPQFYRSGIPQFTFKEEKEKKKKSSQEGRTYNIGRHACTLSGWASYSNMFTSLHDRSKVAPSPNILQSNTCLFYIVGWRRVLPS